MIFTHFLWGISPEDVRATYAGGHREERMGALARKAGFTNEHFQRLTLFQYLFTNGIGATFGWSRPMWWYRVPGRIGRALDTLLTDHIGVLRQSRIELVWGFQKPQHGWSTGK